MKRILFITLLSLLLNNCARYNLVFDTKIYKVEKNDKLISTNNGNNKIKSFEDATIALKLEPNNDYLSIDIENKTNKKININWKKSFFIDTGNLSSNVKTYWQTPVLPNYEQPKTSIPKKSRISERIYRDATFAKQLIYSDIFSKNIPQIKKNKAIDSAKIWLLNRDIRFILYIETEGIDIEYTFTLHVVDVEAEQTFYDPSAALPIIPFSDSTIKQKEEFIILDLFKKKKKSND